MSVVIETTLGDITVDLFIIQRAQTCKNFLKLCAIKYYNSCSFHFVQRDFIAQTGDPTGTGTGGECVYARVPGSAGNFILGEKKPKIKHDRFGLISMVNSGDSGHGSQFFFTLCDSLEYLDGMHTVFGTVVEGADVLVKLNDTICDEKQRPYQDILITHTVVLDDPFPDIEGLLIPPSSPEYNFEELIASDRIGVGEAIVDEDKPLEVLEEEIRDKDAKQRALVLEMIGDLPDADVAPPENVLFVCKLNPVTRDEDLEIIFSRFGTIVSCEIIKDERSGESLQYGFIEFEKEEDCEKAFFKMDNVLIDDRRIHVDFSQSVTKIKWRGKGRGVIHVKDNEANGSRNGKNGHKRRSYEREIATGHGNYRDNQNDYRNPKHSSRQDRTDSRKQIEDSRREIVDSRKHVDSRSRKRSRSRDRDYDRDRDHHHHSTSSSRHHSSSRKAPSSSSKHSRSKHHHDDYDRKDRGRSDRDYHHKSSFSKYHKR